MTNISGVGDYYSNDQFMKKIGGFQGEMSDVQRQVSTDKKHQEFNEFSQADLELALSFGSDVVKHEGNIKTLNTTMLKSNEASDKLRNVQQYLDAKSREWTTLTTSFTNATDDQLKNFARNTLNELENMLNATSNYDGSYMFAGQSSDIKPVDFSSLSTTHPSPTVNTSDWYKGSDQKIYFEHDGRKVEFGFLAKDLNGMNAFITSLLNIKNNTGTPPNADKEAVGNQFTNIKEELGIKKQAFDEKTKEIKSFQEDEETKKEKSCNLYFEKVKLSDVERFEKVVMMQSLGQKLKALYQIQQICNSSSILNFM